MVKTSFGLPAFLRLISLPPNQIVSELKQRKFSKNDGGPPTRVAMMHAMRAVTYDDEAEDVALERLLRWVPKKQRGHISFVFLRFCRLIGQPAIQPAQIPNESTIDGPFDIISVRSVPEISYYRGGNSFVVQHWSTKHTLLTTQLRRLGYAFMRNVGSRNPHDGKIVAMQDLVLPRFGSELDLATASSAEVRRTLENLEQVWMDIDEDTRPSSYVRERNVQPLI